MGSRELQVYDEGWWRWGGVGDKGLLDLLCTSNLIAAKSLEVTMLSAMGVKAGFGGGGGFMGKKNCRFFIRSCPMLMPAVLLANCES